MHVFLGFVRRGRISVGNRVPARFPITRPIVLSRSRSWPGQSRPESPVDFTPIADRRKRIAQQPATDRNQNQEVDVAHRLLVLSKCRNSHNTCVKQFIRKDVPTLQLRRSDDFDTPSTAATVLGNDELAEFAHS